MIKKKKSINDKIKTVSAPSKKKIVGTISLLAIGFILMPTGFILSGVIQNELDKGIADYKAYPSEEEEGYAHWITDDYKDGVPTYISYYMWNLSNPEEFLAGEKPRYEEIGPYEVRIYHNKYNVKYSPNNDRVTYDTYERYEFRESKSSPLTLADNITNINPGYLGVLEEMGGSEEQLVKVMFPIVLQILLEEFETEWEASLPILIDLLGIPEHWGKPNYREVLFEYWANDNVPILNNYTDLDEDSIRYLFRAALHLIFKGGLEPLFPGLDIDGRYGYVGTPYCDLNISTGPEYSLEEPYDAIFYGNPSGIDYTHCEDLWDPENPNSLTGMDVLTNPIWFDAADGDPVSRSDLMSLFDLNITQLNNITNWINRSLDRMVNGWIVNVGEANILEMNSGLITTRTVEEWIFTAVDELILMQEPTRARVNIFYNFSNEVEAEAGKVRGAPRCYTKNTGKKDINEVGQVYKYNGERTIDIWGKDEKVEGTEGLQFAPGVSKEDDLKVFVFHFERVIELEYDDDTEIYDIDLLQYGFSDEVFEANDDYYVDVDGLVNVQPVREIPSFVSKPHFLDADESLEKNVIGMDPKEKDHDTIVCVEPITGITMKGKQRIQVNFKVTPTDLWYTDIRETYMPILWYSEESEIPKDLAEEFKELVYGTLELKESVPIWFLGIGAGVCIPGAALTTSQIIKRRKFKRETRAVDSKLSKNKINAKKKKLLQSNKPSKLETEEIPKFKSEND